MITGHSHTTLWVHDQDEAIAFFTEKLGFEIRTDARTGDLRWVTVGRPEQPDHQIILAKPAPPMLDPESAELVERLLAKGALSGGVITTDDCRADYERLSAAGVNFLTEPTERPYGIEATFRDPSGNWFSFTQRARVPVS